MFVFNNRVNYRAFITGLATSLALGLAASTALAETLGSEFSDTQKIESPTPQSGASQSEDFDQDRDRRGHGRFGHRGFRDGPGHGASDFLKGRWEKLDTNKDDVISKEEYLKEATERFDMADANHDGRLTKDEAKAFFEKVKKLKREAMQKAQKEVESELRGSKPSL